MKSRRNTRLLTAILGLTFLTVSIYWYYYGHLIVRPQPSGSWKLPDYTNSHLGYEDLSEIGFEKLDLTDAKIQDVMDLFISLINQTNHDQKWTCKITPAFLDEKITLQLSNTSASEALRYISNMAQGKYIIHKGRKIHIVPLDYVAPEMLEIKEIDYTFLSENHSVYLKQRGSHDIKDEITQRISDVGASANFSFQPEDSALYFPKEFRVRVKCSRLSHEAVDLCMVTCHIHLTPTVEEKVRNYIQNRSSKATVAPPPPIFPPLPAASDPFSFEPPWFEPVGDLIIKNQTGI